jgi:hypothetical protein
MIFLRHDGQHEPDEGGDFLPARAPSAKFLFDTNERFRKSFIAVTHSKQTTGSLSVRYQWKLHQRPPLCKKIANNLVPQLGDPRA